MTQTAGREGRGAHPPEPNLGADGGCSQPIMWLIPVNDGDDIAVLEITVIYGHVES